MNFVEELRWRGMLHTEMPGTEEKLSKGMTSGYIGFDPTADSLHVGHLTQIMTLIHFQRAGHKPYALVGGATGMVGDPSGKSQERNLLSEDVLQHNLESVKKQLTRFLDFNSGANSAEMVNNYDWFKNFTFLDFIRDVGKHITVNYMMAKDSVKKRLEGDTGMSFTEFTYQLVQGYDFYYLWKHHNCSIQMGGSDQWGNIVTGTELIRRKDSGEAFALTTNLIKKADGTKFGKTESGAVWLDAERTSPYQFYQFWLNTTDVDAKAYIRIFTLFERDVIEALEVEHDAAPHTRILQKALAKDITIRVHGEAAFNLVEKTKNFVFDPNYTWDDLKDLAENDFVKIFESSNKFYISKHVIEGSSALFNNVVEFLNEIDFPADDKSKKLFESKTEIRNLIKNGGLYINKLKIKLDDKVDDYYKMFDKYLFLQKGKKNSTLICITDNPIQESVRINKMLEGE